jgi:hypothetical protein
MILIINFFHFFVFYLTLQSILSFIWLKSKLFHQILAYLNLFFLVPINKFRILPPMRTFLIKSFDFFTLNFIFHNTTIFSYLFLFYYSDLSIKIILIFSTILLIPSIF